MNAESYTKVKHPIRIINLWPVKNLFGKEEVMTNRNTDFTLYQGIFSDTGIASDYEYR